MTASPFDMQTPSGERTREIVFISGDLQGIAALLAAVRPGVATVILDPAQDGLAQIARALDDAGPLDAIHIISHGAPGRVDLGGAPLDQAGIAAHAAELAAIGRALVDAGDLLLYGCDVAAGANGQAFIDALAAATGADVAASNNPTGAAGLGGDWLLEAATGAIEAVAVAAPDFAETLATTFPGGGNGVSGPRVGITLFNLLTEGSSDQSINNLLVGSKWGSGVGAAVSLNVSFSGAGSAYGYADAETQNVAAFSAAQIAAAQLAMGRWAAVANITFTPITDAAGTAGDIRWSQSNNSGLSTAYAYFPSTNVKGGDIWIGPGYSAYRNPTVGGYGFLTFMHELGHALGLTHPHSNPTVLPVAGEDQLKYSIMSYRDYDGDNLNGYGSNYFPTTPMVNDILAIQYLYGANTTTNAGNNTYQWATGAIVYETLWDAGGIDTIDASNQVQAVSLTLEPGEWSQIGALRNNQQGNVRDGLAIAYGAVIENAIGTAFADSLRGNSAANLLTGGGGNDTFFGNTGDDTIDGGAGDDIAQFNGARAGYIITKVGSTVTVIGADGTDTVIAVESLRFADLSVSVDSLPAATVNTAPVLLVGDESPVYRGQGPVIIDSDVRVSDAQLSAQGHYGGATLTLARAGGANAQDLFSTAGTQVGALVQGAALTVGGVGIGTVTVNSAGTLNLTFNSSATEARVNQVMSSLAYANAAASPPATVVMNWIFNDGNGGAQGIGGALAGSGNASIGISLDIPADSSTGANLALGAAVAGTIDVAGDRDWYRVSLAAGTTYEFTLKGSATGNGSLADPELALLDAAGVLLAENGDSGGNSNSRIVFTATDSGTHYISAQGSAGSTGTFLLAANIQETPGDISTTAVLPINSTITGTIDTGGDQDWYRVSLDAGVGYVFQLRGASSGAGTLANPYLGVHDASGTLVAFNDNNGASPDAYLAFTPGGGGTYFVSARDAAAATGTFQLSAAAASVETPPGDTSTAATLAVGGNVGGVIDIAGDQDWYRITLVAGLTYRLELRGAGTGNGTLADPYLRLLDANGTALAADDDGGTGGNALIQFSAAATGTYYLSAQGFGTTAGTYLLSAALVETPPGDTSTTATIAVGGSVTSAIDSAGDRDWYRIALQAGFSYQFELRGAPGANPALAYPFLGLMDAAGMPIAVADQGSPGVNSLLVFTAATSGTYFLSAEALGANSGTYLLGTAVADVPGNLSTNVTIQVNTQVRGAIEVSNDVDWYRITLSAGTAYVFDLRGAATADGTLSDPYLALFNGAGQLVAFDDDGGVDVNSLLVYTAPASGTYYLSAEGYDSFATGTFILAAATISTIDTVAGNISTTATVTAGGAVTGTIETSGDQDWYRITLIAGVQYVFDLRGAPSGDGTLGDPYLRLLDAQGVQVAFDDDGGAGLNAQLAYTASASGTYYLSAEGFPGSSGTFALLTAASRPATILVSSLASTAYVAFDPVFNLLMFDDPGLSAAQILMPLGPDGIVAGLYAGARTIILTPGVPASALTTSNVRFANGSLLVVGDNAPGGGDTAANLLTGSANADQLIALAGNDTLNGGLGNDILNGGTGTDTALLSGNRSAYVITRDQPAGEFIVTGPDGSDRLTGVEMLRFAGSTTVLASLASDTGIVDGFGAYRYLASNRDLIAFYGPDSEAGVAHFVNWGFNEGRGFSGFDGLRYLASNADLLGFYGANAEGAAEHFVRWGLGEGRPTTTFDGYRYLASNLDLIGYYGANPDAAIEHFVRWGYAEGRSATSFDPYRYLASNADLLTYYGSNAAAATEHFVRWGLAEGRPAASFDPAQYFANYADLAAAFGNDLSAAASHFVKYGRFEGRTDLKLVFIGTDGDDALGGNATFNTLAGGPGNDTLTGGGGADSFVFNSALNATTNRDAITDFAAGIDRILLDDAVFTMLTPGNLAATRLVAGAVPQPLESDDVLLYNTGTGTLSYDPDGFGAQAAIPFATFTSLPTLTAADFSVV